jgi:lysophospholipase L1-like esterase
MKSTLAKLNKKEPVTIVAIGDSTSILGSHTKGRMNWFNYLHVGLAETYGDGFIYSINSSFCGATVEQELKRIDRDVCRWDPDLVIISLGIGDSNGGLSRLDKFKDEYREMVSIIREKTGSEILIRVHIPRVFGFGYNIDSRNLLPEDIVPGQAWPGNDKAVEVYAETLVSLSIELNCACCDHYSLWKSKKFHFGHPQFDPQGLCCRYFDTIHPNAQGHLAFYREIASLFKLKKYFYYEEVEKNDTILF